jgi:hypothetical protein
MHHHSERPTYPPDASTTDEEYEDRNEDGPRVPAFTESDQENYYNGVRNGKDTARIGTSKAGRGTAGSQMAPGASTYSEGFAPSLHSLVGVWIFPTCDTVVCCYAADTGYASAVLAGGICGFDAWVIGR